MAEQLCKLKVSERLPVETKHLVFLDEVCRYTAPKPDYLADEYKCHRFYSTRPNPAYYVVDIDHILGPAALFRCPVNPCIPPSGLDRVACQNPSAVSETKTGDGKGSPLYRLNMWYTRWGDTKQAMQIVRRFAKKDTSVRD